MSKYHSEKRSHPYGLPNDRQIIVKVIPTDTLPSNRPLLERVYVSREEAIKDLPEKICP